MYGNKCIMIFHTFCLMLFWWHLSCLKGLTQQHHSLQKPSLAECTGRRMRCITIMVYRWDLRANKPPTQNQGWFVRLIPSSAVRPMLSRQRKCLSARWKCHCMINILLYVRSLNSKTLILQPLLQIHPQKLTHRVCKQRSLSVCSGEHTGRLETSSNTNQPALNSWV